jgi:hypothetical protein
VPLAGHGLRLTPLRRQASRPQLKRDPLGGCTGAKQGATSTSGEAMRSTEARVRRWYVIWKTAGLLLILSAYFVVALAKGQSERASEFGQMIVALLTGGVVARTAYVVFGFLDRHGRLARYLRWALAGNVGFAAILALFATVFWQEPKPMQPDLRTMLHSPFGIGFLVTLATLGAYVSARLWEDRDQWHSAELDDLDAVLHKAEGLYKTAPDLADQLLYDYFVEGPAEREHRALLRRDAPMDEIAATKLRQLLGQDLKRNARVRKRVANVPTPQRAELLRNIDQAAQRIRTELAQLEGTMRRLKSR